MGDGSIRTQFDDLFAALKGAGRQISVPELSSASGMPEKEILKWLHILERQGKVHIENRFSGVYATWLEAEHAKPMADKTAVEVGSTIFSRGRNFSNDLSIAREREDEAKEDFEKTKRHAPESGKESVELDAPQRHRVELAEADMLIADVGKQLENVESMISVLRAQKRIAKELKSKMAEKKAAEKANAEHEKAEQEETISISEGYEKTASAPVPDEAHEQEEVEQLDEEKPPVIEIPISKKETRLEIPEEKEAPAPVIFETNNETEMPEEALGGNQAASDGAEEEKAEAHLLRLSKAREKELRAAFSKIKPLPKKKGKKGMPEKWADAIGVIAPRNSTAKIKKPVPIHVPGVSLQFSERLARQVKKILTQNEEIDKLRQEKEKLLSEHYLPMQRKLESEIETISDRVLRMEKNIIGMQERASNLPNKVSGVEKLQLSSIKAHGQMRRAYDEAAALIEESARELSDGREKMEVMVDQSRQEIASHRAKTVELEKTLSQITQLQTEAGNRVIEARAALGEQAERLASAESHAAELMSLKSEITDGVSAIKREIGTTKAVLTNIEKQMEQVRQVELYAESLRADYEQKMGELGDYIKHGNEDFETLRESVEANFVRRYLKDLRELTDGYSFEFNQAKKAEGSIDERIADEKQKLEGLLEEGRKIAHLYELQSKEVQGAESFEERGEKLAEMPALVEKRTQIESMIAQIVGGRKGEYVPKVASSPIKARAYSKAKPARKLKAKAKKTPKAKLRPARKSKASKKKGRR